MAGTRQLAAGALTLGLALIAGPVAASGDGGCYFYNSLENPDNPCGNTAALAPGNDTRVNLNFLLRDARKVSPVPATMPKRDEWSEFDTSHFGFWDFRAAYWAPVDRSDLYGASYGSRCHTIESGKAPFVAALDAARGVSKADRATLVAARDKLVSECGIAPGDFTVVSHSAGPEVHSPVAREFARYLAGSQAFYDASWATARATFAGLASAEDPWVRETARYMAGRVEVNAALEGAYDEWGNFAGSEKTDETAVQRAAEAFHAYLDTYPNGRYAASARGLQRRVLWLAGDRVRLDPAYFEPLVRALPPGTGIEMLVGAMAQRSTIANRAMLTAIYAGELREGDPGEDFPALLDEVDNKLLSDAGKGRDLYDPLLVATWDLQQMRGWYRDDVPRPLTADDLAAQAPLFAGHEDLYGFLQANYAYYVDEDYKRVMTLIPDAAQQPSYDALQFSRQVLRGMALARRNDRNEAGFWIDMLKGADPVYQRPLVELGLALNYERNGKTPAVFAKGSPITDSGIRMTLLRESAGPGVLRAVIASKRPVSERRTAMRALLWKDLSRGGYAEFVSDYRLLGQFAAAAKSDPEAEVYVDEHYPLDEFRSGAWSEDYACPDILATATKLAANANDVGARLCLGDFYRLNGFDWSDYSYDTGGSRTSHQLGDGPDQFPGKAIPRQTFYRQIVADPKAGADDKAYALYRAVWCYGPSGNNSCGGDDVPKSERKAWFERLKSQYAGTRWARDLKYYW